VTPTPAAAADAFPAQLRDVMHWLNGQKLVEGHPFRDIQAQPMGPTVPEIWVLGSSDYGAQVAAHFGLPYCFAHFITDGRGMEQALEIYRQGYRPSARHPAPHAAICVWALAAETEAEAERLFGPRALWRLGRDRGQFDPLPSEEEAAAYPYTEAERARVARLRERAIMGTGPDVAARLRELGAACGVEEIAVLTTVHDPEARRHSYTLLAEAMAEPGAGKAFSAGAGQDTQARQA
jgi:luciferase family oxidoreductase group 1